MILKFAQGDIKTSVLEAVPVAAGATVDLLNIAPGIPGYVDHLWWVIQDVGAGRDGILNIYVDGEMTPSVTTDVGAFLGHAASTAPAKFNMKNLSFETGGTAFPTVVFRYPIPFKSSIRITYTAPAYQATAIWSIASYRTGVSQPYKLRSSGRTFPNRMIGVTPAQQEGRAVRFLDLPAGKSGTVVFHSICYTFGTDLSFLEVNPVIYLDGLVPGPGVSPQYDTSGVEDYLTSSCYFISGLQANGWMSNTSRGVVLPGSATMALDLLELHGGISFNNGILMTTERGNRNSGAHTITNVDVAWLVLYYEPYP
ncbi:MAG: DUF2961 domain-containing protein [Afipia sp.]|nr:DUF2961 domain-containing protein [Afipia sp.]